jgi:hypothetical protein
MLSEIRYTLKECVTVTNIQHEIRVKLEHGKCPGRSSINSSYKLQMTRPQSTVSLLVKRILYTRER